MRKIISFSLYNNIPLYNEGAIENAELVKKIYPGWTARFYVDDTVPTDVISRLEERGSEIVHVGANNLGPMYGRYWRFWVAADEDVERFIIRDADSRLNSREKAAVDDWTLSGKKFHVMRDSIHHKTRVLGGMWGGQGSSVPNIRYLTDSWGQYSKVGECDRFVSEVIYPLMLDSYICHASCDYFNDAVPFPAHAPMQGTGFVGQIVSLDMKDLDVWRRLGEYGDEVYTLTNEIADLEARLAATKADLSAAKADLSAAKADLSAAKADLSAVHASHSWRATRPLRLMKSAAVRMFRRPHRAPPSVSSAQ